MKVHFEYFRFPVPRKDGWMAQYPGEDRQPKTACSGQPVHSHLWDVITKKFADPNIEKFNVAHYYGGAVCAWTDADAIEGNYHQAWSYCSLTDRFDSKKGKQQAFRKLMENIFGETIEFENLAEITPV